MSNANLLITMASWEERFILGAKLALEAHRPKHVVMYFLNEFASRTAANRTTVEQLCGQAGATLHQQQLDVGDPARSWQRTYEALEKVATGVNVALVDLSTMPREIIWSSLWILQAFKVQARYVYHRPKEYNADWLSRDPGRPRLVFKLSGIADITQSTTLVVLGGFDIQRVQQLIRFYEPNVTLLGLQAGNPYLQNSQSAKEYRRRFERDSSVKLFEIDAYGKDHGQAAVEEMIQPYLHGSNVIMSSLGPKLTAVALYRIQRKLDQIALAYAPSREFNEEYSRGLAESYEGTL